MNNRFRAGASIIAAFCLILGIGTSMQTQTHPQVSSATQKGVLVTTHASGTFEVKVLPQADEQATEAPFGRLTVDKQFHGDLEGTGKGQMLAFGTGAKGSTGAYVALEKVSGTLKGRSGTFVLQHSGTMTRGAMQFNITVVPDSATGQLTGLAGKMNIIITDGKHSYDFDYTLPETP
ncbi:MAG TPA: DUF3224 domain-containing protein [Candidatus Acidoferrales bacterium]|nr:DUF3224 domain-containing protein [Candidatus Acidoferrales bacterium]